MTNLKVIKVDAVAITFENGFCLYDYHDTDCCEQHYLNLADLTINDFEGLEFDLSNDNFFRRIPDYGIELIPRKGHTVKIAGYGYNNGFYSSELTLYLSQNGVKIKQYNITECQKINY